MVKKVCTDDFINKSKKVHGEKYDYSKSIYTSAKIKIIVTCKEHGDFELVPYSHYAGCGCPDCGIETRTNKKRLKLEDIEKRLKDKHGDKYLYKSLEINSVEDRITINCKEHGEFEQRLMNHLRGDGCPTCAITTRAKSKSRNFLDFVVDAKEVHGETYIYPEQIYGGSRTNVKITCPTHGDFEQWADNHLAGHGCPECGKDYASYNTRIGSEELLRRIIDVHGETYNYQTLPNDIYYNSEISITCKIHGPFTQRINVHLMGCGCPKCSMASHASKTEEDLFNFIVTLDDSAIRHQRILEGKEIDIYLPDRKIGIELHGNYWHREEKGKSHLLKHDIAVSQGIRLIQIFEDEWVLKREVVKHTLSMLLGKLPSIGARETVAKRLEHREVKQFLDQYHLQGSHTGSDYVGLYRKEDLISVAVFGNSRFNKGDLELIRYATKFPVLGGMSKILKNFSQSNSGKTLHSYSDLRWFLGTAYERSGFQYTGRTTPGYFWCKKLVRLSRFKFQKHKIKSIIPEADLALTEDQIATSAGYFKLYDCGHSKWSRLL